MKTINAPTIIAVIQSRKVKGKARRFPYWEATEYKAVQRVSGKITYHPTGKRSARPRRSSKLAYEDAKLLAALVGGIVAPEVGAWYGVDVGCGINLLERLFDG